MNTILTAVDDTCLSYINSLYAADDEIKCSGFLFAPPCTLYTVNFVETVNCAYLYLCMISCQLPMVKFLNDCVT